MKAKRNVLDLKRNNVLPRDLVTRQLLESLRTTLDTINQSSFSTMINVPVNYAIRPSGPMAGLHSLRLRRELILNLFIDPGVGHSMPDGTAHSTKILESLRPV
jgi:hypothetical protein